MRLRARTRALASARSRPATRGLVLRATGDWKRDMKRARIVSDMSECNRLQQLPGSLGQLSALCSLEVSERRRLLQLPLACSGRRRNRWPRPEASALRCDRNLGGRCAGRCARGGQRLQFWHHATRDAQNCICPAAPMGCHQPIHITGAGRQDSTRSSQPKHHSHSASTTSLHTQSSRTSSRAPASPSARQTGRPLRGRGGSVSVTGIRQQPLRGRLKAAMQAAAPSKASCTTSKPGPTQHDVAAAEELALDVDLGEGGPLAVPAAAGAQGGEGGGSAQPGPRPGAARIRRAPPPWRQGSQHLAAAAAAKPPRPLTPSCRCAAARCPEC
jgi:hypothetical protein